MSPATYLALALLLPPALEAKQSIPPAAEPVKTVHTLDGAASYPTQQARLRHDVSAYLGSLLGTVLYNEGMRAEDLDFDQFIYTFATRLALQGQKVPEPDQNAIDTRTAMEAIHAKMEQRKQAIAEKNGERSRRFLEENAKKPGIVTTPSGLQYRIDKQGPNPTRTPSPKNSDEHAIYSIKYTVDTLDGTMIDNPSGAISIIRGLRIPPIPAGFHEALKLMNPGSTWTFYIPPSIGFGEKQRDLAWFSLVERQTAFDQQRICQPCLRSNSILIMQIELIDYAPFVPLSLNEIDSVYIDINHFWGKPALSIAEMQLIVAHQNEGGTDNPHPSTQTPVSAQELRTITSRTVARLLGKRMVDEGFILQDIDMSTFRTQLEQALSSPPSMENMNKQHAAASSMAATYKQEISSNRHKRGCRAPGSCTSCVPTVITTGNSEYPHTKATWQSPAESSKKAYKKWFTSRLHPASIKSNTPSEYRRTHP